MQIALLLVTQTSRFCSLGITLDHEAHATGTDRHRFNRTPEGDGYACLIRAVRPSGAARSLAELRRLRERAGLTGDEAAATLNWSGSKISRIELNRIGVKRDDLDKLLDLYKVESPYREELQALASESSKTGRLRAVVAGLPTDYAEYVSAEDEARSIWNWEPLIVPGLLQTEGYTRAVMAGYQSMFRIPPGDAERRIVLRRMRQQLLTREPPLQLSFVIDESVLRRRFGSNSAMHGQLLRVTEVSEMPNVDIRILPLGGEHPTTPAAFSYMQFPQVHDVPLRDIVKYRTPDRQLRTGRRRADVPVPGDIRGVAGEIPGSVPNPGI